MSKISLMRLSDLKTGESAVIIKVFGHGGFRRRILEMGFVRGQKVIAILCAPLKDPVKYSVMGYEVSLRRSEAEMIEVITEEEAANVLHREKRNGTSEDEDIQQVIRNRSHEINVALVGNPNSGKTSLFNALSGGHEHVGNYSGVTVGAKSGSFHYKDYKFNITDLPGTYALSAYTPEELYVREHLINEKPDVVINAVVASNLERNLYLTTELIDANPSMVVALNMYDELKESGAILDYDMLGRMLGVPMIPVVARNSKGLDHLMDAVISVYEDTDERVRHIHINHSPCIEEAIHQLTAPMKEHLEEIPHCFPPRYWALKMIEEDSQVEKLLSTSPHFPQWKEIRDKEVVNIKRELKEDVETAITNEKYGFIAGALQETYVPGKQDNNPKTSLIDKFVTNKWLGFPIFILFMVIMFCATFWLGKYPQDGIEWLVERFGAWIGAMMSDGPLKSLLIDGIIGGVGSVIVFLPNILILYLFISIMEDSGYMARTAFIMDKIMHRIGLHGKSFIPLVMGFGCNVPSIMATRTIESHSSRIITILINPFISCSARLPVFLLLSGLFFPNYAGLALSGMYFLGIIVAVISARIMRRFVFKKDETPFVMELPPYRVPTVRATMRHMWEKSEQYLKKMGTIILGASIIIWFLSYYPHTTPNAPHHGTATEMTAAEMKVIRSENSFLGRLGKFCEPVMRPIGLNWKATVSLISGTAAKEIIVSTLGVLYPGNGNDSSLEKNIKASGDFDSRSALSFMIFILLYCPCIATLSAIKNETGSWKWVAVSVIYNTSLAWLLAFVAYFLVGFFII